jgi:hypothetical protein
MRRIIPHRCTAYFVDKRRRNVVAVAVAVAAVLLAREEAYKR